MFTYYCSSAYVCSLGTGPVLLNPAECAIEIDTWSWQQCNCVIAAYSWMKTSMVLLTLFGVNTKISYIDLVVTWASVICLIYTHDARGQVQLYKANHECGCYNFYVTWSLMTLLWYHEYKVCIVSDSLLWKGEKWFLSLADQKKTFLRNHWMVSLAWLHQSHNGINRPRQTFELNEGLLLVNYLTVNKMRSQPLRKLTITSCLILL